MSHFDSYRDDRFDSRLQESDAHKRHYARLQAAEARSYSRAIKRGPYASGRLSPHARRQTRALRNHYDAREEFARLDEEAQERTVRRIAKLHGIAPRSIGQPPTDPYEREHIERLSARLLRERAEQNERKNRRNKYHSARYRDRSRAQAEKVEDPSLFEEVHRSLNQPHLKEVPRRKGSLGSLLSFLRAAAVQPQSHVRRSSRSDTTVQHELEKSLMHKDPQEMQELHSFGVERTQAQWRSRPSHSSDTGRNRNANNYRKDSREGFSIRRNQINMSPYGNNVFHYWSGLAVGSIGTWVIIGAIIILLLLLIILKLTGVF